MTLFSLRCINNESADKENTMVAKITERQGQYLSFIFQYVKVNGRSPAESDIQRYFGVSPPTVHQMVVKLESLGLITRRPGVARSIEVLASPDDIPALK
ncbi:MAG: helix-turn-helix domain-containing protein [Thiogranum sp.]